MPCAASATIWAMLRRTANLHLLISDAAGWASCCSKAGDFADCLRLRKVATHDHSPTYLRHGRPLECTARIAGNPSAACAPPARILLLQSRQSDFAVQARSRKHRKNLSDPKLTVNNYPANFQNVAASCACVPVLSSSTKSTRLLHRKPSHMSLHPRVRLSRCVMVPTVWL